jgi:hypothetical protein
LIRAEVSAVESVTTSRSVAEVGDADKVIATGIHRVLNMFGIGVAT